MSYGDAPNEPPKGDPASKMIQSKSELARPGYSLPDKIMGPAELAAFQGGSSEIQTNGEFSRRGYSEPQRVSSADLNVTRLAPGSAEFMDEALQEQRVNQTRNQLGRYKGGHDNEDGTSAKTA